MGRGAQNTAVSVIMPAYNAQSFIGEALRSLSDQDCLDFEVVVVDDGSTDATCEIVKRFASSDNRVRLIELAHAGAGQARNAGMEAATGEYLLFLDADDVFDPSLVSTLYAAAVVTDADVCVCSADCFTADPAHPVKRWEAKRWELAGGLYTAGQLAPTLYQNLSPVVWNKLFKAKLVKDLNLWFQDLPRFNDAYFTCVALACARTLCKVEDVLVHYRIGSGSSLQDASALHPLCDLEALDALRGTLAEYGLLDEAHMRSLQSLCVNTIVWRLAHFARTDRKAAQALYDAYFGRYCRTWGLDRARFPYLFSVRYAIEHALMKRAGAQGLVAAAQGDRRNRASKPSALAEAGFCARLAAESLRTLARRAER